MPKNLKKYKDKEKARVIRNKQRAANYEYSRQFAIHHHQRYTIGELKMILDHDIPDRELGARLGRSVVAIQVLRAKLKKAV